MKKSFLIAALMLVLAAILCACTSGVRGGGKVNFGGALSEQSYSEIVEAVKAFLTEEISGDSSEIEYVSYKKRSDLTVNEILALGIESASVAYAEKGVVAYTDSSENGESVNKNHELYIITQSDGMIRYFAPPSRVGEMITRSEYEEIFLQNNYTCKISSTTVDGEKTECIGKIDGNRIWAEEKASLSSSYGLGSEITMRAYIDLTGDKSVMYVDEGYGWIDTSSFDYEFNEILDELFGQQSFNDICPFEWLERTSYGYGIPADKMQNYYDNLSPFLNDMSNDILSSVGGSVYVEYNDMHGSMEYYVKDGLLSECRGNVGGTMTMVMDLWSEFGTLDEATIESLKKEFKESMKQYGINGDFDDQGNFRINQKTEMTSQCRYYDYGVTEITLPADLEEYIALNR